MTLQQLLSKVRKAVTDYGMIEDGDAIAVGLSGGKDSIALLTALAAYSRFSPESFSLHAVTIDMGLGADYAPLEKYCENLEVPLRIERTEIGRIIFDERKEKNPCSLCAKMRRGALNTAAKELKCNKLALGHHADDLVETMLLSLLYEGRLSSFAPTSFMSRMEITLIRPMIYADEKDVISISRDYPVVHNPCPANHFTQREYVKNLIKEIQKTVPEAKERILSALTHPERYNLNFEKKK